MKGFIFCNTDLISTGWVRSTICNLNHWLTALSSVRSQLTSEILLKKNLWSHDLNLGRLGMELERYLCAMPTPQTKGLLAVKALAW